MLCCKSTLNLWQKLKAPVKNLKVNCDTLPEKRYVFNSGFKPSDKCPRCYQHLGPKLDLFIRGLLTIAGFIFFFNLVFLIATIVFFFYRCVFASMWFGNQGPHSSQSKNHCTLYKKRIEYHEYRQKIAKHNREVFIRKHTKISHKMSANFLKISQFLFNHLPKIPVQRDRSGTHRILFR